jgi:hypothetical protein
MQVNIHGSGPSENRLQLAQDNRLRDLISIARLGNRRFGLGIKTILGVQVEGGVA